MRQERPAAVSHHSAQQPTLTHIITKSKDQTANFIFIVDFDDYNDSEISRAILLRTKKDYWRTLRIYNKLVPLNNMLRLQADYSGSLDYLPQIPLTTPEGSKSSGYLNLQGVYRGYGTQNKRPNLVKTYYRNGRRMSGNFKAGIVFYLRHKFLKEGSVGFQCRCIESLCAQEAQFTKETEEGRCNEILYQSGQKPINQCEEKDTKSDCSKKSKTVSWGVGDLPLMAQFIYILLPEQERGIGEGNSRLCKLKQGSSLQRFTQVLIAKRWWFTTRSLTFCQHSGPSSLRHQHGNNPMAGYIITVVRSKHRSTIVEVRLIKREQELAYQTEGSSSGRLKHLWSSMPGSSTRDLKTCQTCSFYLVNRARFITTDRRQKIT